MHDKLIHTNMDDFSDYLKDESRTTGNALSISFPEDVSEILEIIKNRRGKITIQGARTGITGGAVPYGGHILNCSRMNRILALSASDDSNIFYLKVQPGLVLTDLRTAVATGDIDTTGWGPDSIRNLNIMKKKGTYFFPPDPTEPSASIGGMIACNASGACSFLYGPTRNYIRALTILFADGSITSLQRENQMAAGRSFTLSTNQGKVYKGNLPMYTMPGVKNASGYFVRDNMDLIDLFIGSEGTLGIIIDADIRLIPKPAFTWGITCFLPGNDQAIEFVQICRGDSPATQKLPLQPAAIEFFDTRALYLLSEMKAANPAFSSIPHIPDNVRSAVYVEFHSDNENILDDTLVVISAMIEQCGGNEEMTWFASETHEMERLLSFRHAIPEAVNLFIDMKKKQGLTITKLGTDMAVQNEKLADVYRLYHSVLEESKLNYVMFGHIGDNHIHINILPETEEEYKWGLDIYKTWAKVITDMGGTVSAEHGIGKLKTDFLKIMYGEKGVGEMAALKKVFDPDMILNPGNLFSIA